MATGDLVAYNDQTPLLVSRLNKSTVISGSGAYLASLSLGQFKLLHCTSTGSGYTIDHLYLVKGDGTSAIDISGIADHTHSGSGDGGAFTEIFTGMAEHIYVYLYQIVQTEWNNVTSGTGSVEEHDDLSGWTENTVLKLLTGTTSASTSNIKHAGFGPSWSEFSGFLAYFKLDQTTDIASRWGYYMDNLNSADTNTRRHGLAQCTSVNNNWFGNTANGSSRSESDTGTAISTSATWMKSECHPAGDSHNGSPHQDVSIDGTLKLTKTNDIPTGSSGPNDSNLFRVSLKNNTGSSKSVWLIKLKYAYQANDWWG